MKRNKIITAILVSVAALTMLAIAGCDPLDDPSQHAPKVTDSAVVTH
jgi:hypothetical protein